MFDRLQRTLDDRRCDRALQAVAAGNLQALTVVYRCYGRMICALAAQLVGGSDQAEDVLQETMLQLARNAGSYRPGTNPRAWCLTVARNLALDARRRTAREQPAELPDLLLAPAQPDPLRRLELDEALSLLTEEERQLVFLKLHAGLTHAEIAAMLGLPPAGCERKYQRTIQKLRKMLSDSGEE